MVQLKIKINDFILSLLRVQDDDLGWLIREAKVREYWARGCFWEKRERFAVVLIGVCLASLGPSIFIYREGMHYEDRVEGFYLK